MNRKKIIGNLGESLASLFLEDYDYKIVKRNYRYKNSEIDIIAKKDGVLVFVEVKTRKNNDYGNPEDAVGKAKIAAVTRAIEAYIEDENWEGDIRFDVISISLNPEPTIMHLEDLSL